MGPRSPDRLMDLAFTSRNEGTIVQVWFYEERFHRVCNVTMMDGLLQ
jgi:hypothetical protein